MKRQLLFGDAYHLAKEVLVLLGVFLLVSQGCLRLEQVLGLGRTLLCKGGLGRTLLHKDSVLVQ